MTKKLFVVLVVVAAMLVTISWAIAAKKASTPVDATEYTPPTPLLPGGGERMVVDKTIPPEKLDFEVMEAGEVQWEMFPGGVPQVFGQPKQDTCEVTMHSGAMWWYRGLYWPDEIYAEYQDPETSDPPCPFPVYPFAVTNLYIHVQDTTSNPFDVVGYFDVHKADFSDPDCPKPGALIYQSPDLMWSLPYGTHWRLSYSPASPVCVNGPYFVSFYIYYQDPWYELGPITDGTADLCRSYYDWGSGWGDWIELGTAGNFLIYSAGLSYDDPHNVCPAKPECEYYLWHDGITWYSYSGYDAGAVWYASPRTGYIARGRILFATSSSGDPDAWFFLWDGNPTTGPGSKIDSIYVPASDITYEPDWVEVDFTYHNITIDVGDYIFFGYEPVPDLRWLSDVNGNGVETHSWIHDGTGWYDEYTYWGDYAEYMMELEICGEQPCDTDTVLLSDHGTATWIWALPSVSGRKYPNQRFTLPFAHGGRLDEVRLAFFGMTGTPSPDVYVWADDGAGLPLDANPPNNAIASYHINNVDVVTYPISQVVQTWQDGIYFDPGEEFHVGYQFDFSIVGDTLSFLTDDYTDPGNLSDRASFWWPGDPDYWENCYDHYGIYMSLIFEALICVTAPPESTFVLQVAPTTGYISPGDANFNLYDITVTPVAGYALNVALDIEPTSLPAGITYSYDPANGTPEFFSDLYINCDVGVSYGSYVLTLRGTGTVDGQVRTKNVTLIVQPPFDECEVDFYHGMQRGSNFGAVGNDAKDNFVYYGANYLFDGSFIIGAPQGPIRDFMALDIYNCEYVGWLPSAHVDEYYDAEYDANICYASFYSTNILTEFDSVYFVGIMDECVDFSIKIKVYYNPPDGDPIPELWVALFEDWDVGNAYDNWVDMDPAHNLIWQWDPALATQVFGILKAPYYDDAMHSMVGVNNAYYVWPNAGFCDSTGEPGYEFYGLDSLWALMTTPGYRMPVNINPDSNDMSLLVTPPPFALNPGDRHIEVWINFGFDGDFSDPDVRRHWWHRVLRYAGFYRGDVNASDTLEVPAMDVSDLVYLIQYLFRGGPAPLPFADQGDVDGSCCGGYPESCLGCVNIGDVIYLLNYVFMDGPPPIDYVRFIPQCWPRESLFEANGWE